MPDTTFFHWIPTMAARPVGAIDLMSSPVVSIPADAAIDDVAATMLRTGFTTLPVVDSYGKVVKIITEDGVARAYLAHLWADGMTPEEDALIDYLGVSVFDFAVDTVSVQLHSTLAEIAEVMLRAQLRAIPVLHGGKPIGMISWRDVFARIARSPATRPEAK